MQNAHTTYQVTSLPDYHQDPLDYYRSITTQLDDSGRVAQPSLWIYAQGIEKDLNLPK